MEKDSDSMGEIQAIGYVPEYSESMSPVHHALQVNNIKFALNPKNFLNQKFICNRYIPDATCGIQIKWLLFLLRNKWMLIFLLLLMQCMLMKKLVVAYFLQEMKREEN